MPFLLVLFGCGLAALGKETQIELRHASFGRIGLEAVAPAKHLPSETNHNIQARVSWKARDVSAGRMAGFTIEDFP
jgi:hypothetical protein